MGSFGEGEGNCCGQYVIASEGYECGKHIIFSCGFMYHMGACFIVLMW